MIEAQLGCTRTVAGLVVVQEAMVGASEVMEVLADVEGREDTHTHLDRSGYAVTWQAGRLMILAFMLGGPPRAPQLA